MAQPYLSIIVPAYNEAKRIPKTLLDMDKHLARADYSYEIIVVNDGSTDNTAEVVANLAKLVKNVKLVNGAENMGKGGTVRQGMLMASGVIHLFSDADNSTPIDQFDQMIPLFKQGYQVIIGSRAVHGATLDPPEPLHRRVVGKCLNLLIQLLLVPGISDTQCGFKAFTAEAARKVFESSRVRGWGFDFEILALARRMGYRIAEVPVHWINDEKSHMSMRGGLQFLADIFRIRWWLWRGVYDHATVYAPSSPDLPDKFK
jgi:dolichyl-phosphate beta-glucosyltransferase